MNKFLIGGAAAAAMLAGGTALAQSAPAAKQAPAPRAETRADVQAHIATLFAKLDANKDGFIAKDEIKAIEAKRDQKLEKRAESLDPSKAFAKFDANKDGKLTAADVQGKTGKQAKMATALIARADANKDKVVTRAEFDTLTGKIKARLEKAAESNGPGDRLFAHADANKDGRVSLAEMQQDALSRFDRVDANKDGKVSPAERKQARAELLSQRKPS
jgi:Ca2+-binding EF-hand superfamily protein